MFMRTKVKETPMTTPKLKDPEPKPAPRNGSPVDRLFDLAAELETSLQNARELMAEFREMTLALWEENDQLRKQAADAEQTAKEKIMKRFLET